MPVPTISPPGGKNTSLRLLSLAVVILLSFLDLSGQVAYGAHVHPHKVLRHTMRQRHATRLRNHRSTVGTAYTITGTVYNDANQSGTQDGTEPGLAGVVITAYDASNSVVASTTSNSNGNYILNIAAGVGSTRIQFTNFGASSTAPDLIGYQASNQTGGTSVAFIDGSSPNYTVNLGLESPSDICAQIMRSKGIHALNKMKRTGTSGRQTHHRSVSGKTGSRRSEASCVSQTEIGNRVWLDTNGNGIQDASEPGIPGVTVDLYDDAGTTLLDHTTTDANGAYYFVISSATAYIIKLDKSTDYAAGGPLGGYRLTVANQDSTYHLADSKAVLPTPANPIGSDNYPQVSVDTHSTGQNDYTFDIGMVASPDLKISQTNVGGNGPFVAGQTFNYTLSVSDVAGAGPVVADQPVSVTDTIPAGLSNVTISANNGWNFSTTAPSILKKQISGHKVAAHSAKSTHMMALAQQKVSKSIKSLHPSILHFKHVDSPLLLTATYTGPYPVLGGMSLPNISVSGMLTVAGLPQIINSAAVNTPYDSDASNNTTSNTINVTAQPDLSIALSYAGNTCFTGDQQVTYTAIVSNAQNADAVPEGQSVVVTLNVPAPITNATASGTDWTVTSSTFDKIVLTYSGAYPINPGASLSAITMTGTVSSTYGNYDALATVSTSNDSNNNNNSSSSAITLCAYPDLSVTETHEGNGPFQVGQKVNFTLSVSNASTAGVVPVGPVRVIDTLPAGFTQVSASAASDWNISVSGNTVTADYTGLFPIASGSQLTPILITGTLTNVAVPSISKHSAVPGISNGVAVLVANDTNPDNNVGSDSITVLPAPDLGIAISHSVSCYNPGDTYNYVVSVNNAANAGPVESEQHITVDITIPSDLGTGAISTNSDWTVVGHTNNTVSLSYTGTYPVLPGATLSPITVTGTVISNITDTSIGLTAKVSNDLDTNSANNSATDSIDACVPDLTISKTHSGSSPFRVGQTVDFTISVSNLFGAGALLNGEPVTVTDTLPDGLVNVVVSGTNWDTTVNFNVLTATYTGPYPVTGGSSLPNIVVSGLLTSDAVPTLTNGAFVSDARDSNLQNNWSDDSIDVKPLPDLHLKLDHQGHGCFKRNHDVTYRIEVSNHQDAGPVLNDEPIIVTFTIPSKLNSITYSGSNWDINKHGSTITATYTGQYPVNGGDKLPIIYIRGTISKYAHEGSTLKAYAKVETPNDQNNKDNSARDDLRICQNNNNNGGNNNGNNGGNNNGNNNGNNHGHGNGGEGHGGQPGAPGGGGGGFPGLPPTGSDPMM